MARERVRDGAYGGDQRLREHLPTEDALHHRVGLATAEQVVLDHLQVEQVDQLFYGGRHRD